MNKKGKRKGKQKRKQKRKQYGLRPQAKIPQKPKKKISILLKIIFSKSGFIWSVIVFISVILGIIGTMYSLSPKITVTPSEPYNSLNPYNSSFTIANEGLLPLGEVNVTCLTPPIPFELNKKKLHVMSEDGAGGLIGETINSLGAGEKRNINCISMAGWYSNTIVERNSVIVAIKYRSIWLSKQQEKKYKFDATKNIDGKFIWKPQQLYEK